LRVGVFETGLDAVHEGILGFTAKCVWRCEGKQAHQTGRVVQLRVEGFTQNPRILGPNPHQEAIKQQGNDFMITSAKQIGQVHVIHAALRDEVIENDVSQHTLRES
jgi:hypothetical protein